MPKLLYCALLFTLTTLLACSGTETSSSPTAVAQTKAPAPAAASIPTQTTAPVEAPASADAPLETTPDPHPARIGLTDQIPLPNKGFPSGFLVGVKEFNERNDHG